MPQITVASLNPVKLRAASARLPADLPAQRTFHVSGVAVPSGVPDQPLSLAETLKGARNRAENARAARP